VALLVPKLDDTLLLSEKKSFSHPQLLRESGLSSQLKELDLLTFATLKIVIFTIVNSFKSGCG
jgi:hypothetical protein